MRIAQLARPTRGGEPSDILRSYVFSANLASQEATGSMEASTSIARVLRRLEGSEESDALLLVLIDDTVTPVIGPVGPLGIITLPSTGDERSFEALAFCFLSLPLLEESDTCEIDLTLDAGLQPLPGDQLSDEALSIREELLRGVSEICERLNRPVVQWWADGRHPGAPGFERAVDVTHYSLSPQSLHATAPQRTVVIEDYASGSHRADLGRLLSISAEDAFHGDVIVEPAVLDSERLDGARSRAKDRGDRILDVMLVDDRQRGVALAELTAPQDSTVAELTTVVVDRTRRHEGLGRAVLDASMKEVRNRWPNVTELYVALAAEDHAGHRLLRPYDMSELQTMTCWQKVMRR